MLFPEKIKAFYLLLPLCFSFFFLNQTFTFKLFVVGKSIYCPRCVLNSEDIIEFWESLSGSVQCLEICQNIAVNHSLHVPKSHSFYEGWHSKIFSSTLVAPLQIADCDNDGEKIMAILTQCMPGQKETKQKHKYITYCTYLQYTKTFAHILSL